MTRYLTKSRLLWAFVFCATLPPSHHCLSMHLLKVGQEPLYKLIPYCEKTSKNILGILVLPAQTDPTQYFIELDQIYDKEVHPSLIEGTYSQVIALAGALMRDHRLFQILEDLLRSHPMDFQWRKLKPNIQVKVNGQKSIALEQLHMAYENDVLSEAWGEEEWTTTNLDDDIQKSKMVLRRSEKKLPNFRRQSRRFLSLFKNPGIRLVSAPNADKSHLPFILTELSLENIQEIKSLREDIRSKTELKLNLLERLSTGTVSRAVLTIVSELIDCLSLYVLKLNELLQIEPNDETFGTLQDELKGLRQDIEVRSMSLRRLMS